MFAALAVAQHVIDGAELRVSEADPKPGQGGGGGAPQAYGGGGGSRGGGGSEYRLFVGSIMEGISDDDLRAYFGNFGAIKDVYRPGRQKAGEDGSTFGFVIFEQYNGVSKALAETNHAVNGYETNDRHT